MVLKHAVAFAFGLAFLTACAEPSATNAPAAATIPPETVVTAPAADVPANYAAFSGTWGGTWGTSLDGKLAVMEVAANGSVEAIYAWGDSPGDFEAGHRRRDGVIEGDTLTLETFGNGAVASYVLANGVLEGKYDRGGNVTRGTFRRIE